MNKFIIGVDFDGTLAANEYPGIGIGRDLGGLFYLSQLKNAGCELFVWTCRDGERLKEAEVWLTLHGYDAVFITINTRTPSTPFDSRKLFANVYVDDRALGAPIRKYADDRIDDHFDWDKAGPMLIKLAADTMKRWKKEAETEASELKP